MSDSGSSKAVRRTIVTIPDDTALFRAEALHAVLEWHERLTGGEPWSAVEADVLARTAGQPDVLRLVVGVAIDHAHLAGAEPAGGDRSRLLGATRGPPSPTPSGEDHGTPQGVLKV